MASSHDIVRNCLSAPRWLRAFVQGATEEEDEAEEEEAGEGGGELLPLLELLCSLAQDERCPLPPLPLPPLPLPPLPLPPLYRAARHAAAPLLMSGAGTPPSARPCCTPRGCCATLPTQRGTGRRRHCRCCSATLRRPPSRRKSPSCCSGSARPTEAAGGTPPPLFRTQRRAMCSRRRRGRRRSCAASRASRLPSGWLSLRTACEGTSATRPRHVHRRPSATPPAAVRHPTLLLTPPPRPPPTASPRTLPPRPSLPAPRRSPAHTLRPAEDRGTRP